MMTEICRKARIATASLAGCFGCHMAILDIDERLIDLMKLVEFDRSPLTDKKRFTQRCDIGIIEGGCCNEENVMSCRDFRRNCDVLIALGQCAIMGGLPAMRNAIMHSDEPAARMPGGGLHHRPLYPKHDPQHPQRSGAAAAAR
jgi:NAD-reducing hydrogenase small subunit